MPRSRFRGHAALRRGRISCPGGIYLVTFTTQDRATCFVDHGMATVACRAITDRRLWRHSELLAWVLMPDHWHGIVRLGEAEPLSSLVGRVKANSSRQVRASHTVARVWARAFQDRALRRDESVLDAARYVVMNPVRAGLVASPSMYPYWDAASIGHDDLLPHLQERRKPR